MLEKQSIPSFENLTADMQRIRISEFFNPRADCDPIVGGTTVNVRAEQEKIFVTKLDQKVKVRVTYRKEKFVQKAESAGITDKIID